MVILQVIFFTLLLVIEQLWILNLFPIMCLLMLDWFLVGYLSCPSDWRAVNCCRWWIIFCNDMFKPFEQKSENKRKEKEKTYLVFIYFIRPFMLLLCVSTWEVDALLLGTGGLKYLKQDGFLDVWCCYHFECSAKLYFTLLLQLKHPPDGELVKGTRVLLSLCMYLEISISLCCCS